MMSTPTTASSFAIGAGIFAIAAHIARSAANPRAIAVAAPEPDRLVPVSVNYHFTRVCNYECRFCFHTNKGGADVATIEDAKTALRLLAAEGMRKINFSGGEPFLQPKWLGEMARFCDEELQLESVSIVSNGSRITREWLAEFGRHISMIALSIDSADPDTLEHIGRTERGGGGGRTYQTEVVRRVAAWIREAGIELRINTTVTKASVDEDMNAFIAALKPKRWKVFQMLLVEGENFGAGQSNGRDATDLVITDAEFQSFIERHRAQESLVVEDNETMRNSYLILDERLRFLNCRNGDKRPTGSILKVGVQAALRDCGFDSESFHKRRGVYDWGRQRAAPAAASLADIEEIV